VPQLQSRVRGGCYGLGKILGYPLDSLYEEVAFIAYHFHWDLQRILELEHPERAHWVAEISSLNERANEEAVDV
jgi:hypothetical protein